MNISVKFLLQRKGSDIWSTTPDATIFDALQFMAEKDIGALMVIENDKLIGIFSERDYARKVILHGKSARETLVQEIMTRDVITVQAAQSVVDCMSLMTEKHIRHLPVLDNAELVGMISIGDVVKEIISEQGYLIEQLENYISGNR
ncbi:MAG: CBS domain-containing protein [Anaerolineales bacterium]|nr:CBS domain-containing protein [Chloroflexota bacterium]MBL6980445.1 CBS domain-containing protein [Anaerolineales bacterium]